MEIRMITSPSWPGVRAFKRVCDILVNLNTALETTPPLDATGTATPSKYTDDKTWTIERLVTYSDSIYSYAEKSMMLEKRGCAICLSLCGPFQFAKQSKVYGFIRISEFCYRYRHKMPDIFENKRMSNELDVFEEEDELEENEDEEEEDGAGNDEYRCGIDWDNQLKYYRPCSASAEAAIESTTFGLEANELSEKTSNNDSTEPTNSCTAHADQASNGSIICSTNGKSLYPYLNFAVNPSDDSDPNLHIQTAVRFQEDQIFGKPKHRRGLRCALIPRRKYKLRTFEGFTENEITRL